MKVQPSRLVLLLTVRRAVFDSRGQNPEINISLIPSHVFKVHCGSTFEPDASGFPYYCTPPVTVPDAIGVRAV